MSDQAIEQVAKNPQIVSPDATTSANAVGSNGENSAKKVSTGDTFSSMDELRTKYPELYNLMMQGQMISFIKKQERANDRLKELNRKAREDQSR